MNFTLILLQLFSFKSKTNRTWNQSLPHSFLAAGFEKNIPHTCFNFRKRENFTFSGVKSGGNGFYVMFLIILLSVPSASQNEKDEKFICDK